MRALDRGHLIMEQRSRRVRRDVGDSREMGFIEPFGRAMIEAFLEGDDLHYLRDRDGDFIVQFGYDEELKGHPRFLLAVSGEDGEQFCLRGDLLRRVPRHEWDRALRLCNEWNTHYKMPKVYFEVDDENASPTGRVVCEQWLDLEVGIPQELLNHFVSTFFSACFGFWRWHRRQDSIDALIDSADEIHDDEEDSTNEDDASDTENHSGPFEDA